MFESSIQSCVPYSHPSSHDRKTIYDPCTDTITTYYQDDSEFSVIVVNRANAPTTTTIVRENEGSTGFAMTIEFEASMIPTIRTVVNVTNDNQAIRTYTLGQYLTSQTVPDHVTLEHDLASVLQEQKRKELIASDIQDAGDYFMAYWLETCPGNLESRKRPLHAKIKAWIKQNLEEFNALDFPFSGRSKRKPNGPGCVSATPSLIYVNNVVLSATSMSPMRCSVKQFDD
jgi:hypothetical protein